MRAVFNALNNDWASAVVLGPGVGVAGTPVGGVLTGLDDFTAGVVEDDEGAALCAGVREGFGAAEVRHTGSAPVPGGWYPSGPTLADGAADVRATVTSAVGWRAGMAEPALSEVALERLSGSMIAPAKVNGRRPSEVAMAMTATALIAVAAADSHTAGARTAGMSEIVPCPNAKSPQRIDAKS